MTISLPCVALESRCLWGIFSSVRGLISIWQNHHSWMQKLLITLILAYLVIFPASCVMNLLCNWGHKGVSAHPNINQGLIRFELTISRTMARLFSSFNRKQRHQHHSERIQNCPGQNHTAACKFLIDCYWNSEMFCFLNYDSGKVKI